MVTERVRRDDGRRFGTLRWSPAVARRASPTAGLLRRRLLGVRAGDVVEIVDAVEAAGSHCVVLGGWAVDALVGHRTRRHADLDLAVDDGTPRPTAVAAGVLVTSGFGLVRQDHVPTARFAHRWLYEDARGRLVDLHPARLDPLPAGERVEPGVPVLTADAIATGWIGTRAVRCLSAAGQLELRREYQERPVDQADLRLLERLAGGVPG
jgi:lincosamide nucleotidyltransferase A/C/D/E